MSRELFANLETQYGLPANLLNAVMQAESMGNTRAVSPKGARGAFQFMPETAKQYGVNVNDLTSSATGAARMYADLLKQNSGDLPKALAGYNWGIGNVQRKGMDNMPTETRNYIQKVTANMGKPQTQGRDYSAELFGDEPAKQSAGRDYSAELFGAAAPEPDAKAPEHTEGRFTGEGVLRGIYDPFTGLAQGAYNLMPKSVQKAGDRLNDYIADKTGMLPKIGPKGFNRAIAENEAEHIGRLGKLAGACAIACFLNGHGR